MEETNKSLYNTQNLDFYFKCNHKENPKIEQQFYTAVHNHWSELQMSNKSIHY